MNNVEEVVLGLLGLIFIIAIVLCVASMMGITPPF